MGNERLRERLLNAAVRILKAGNPLPLDLETRLLAEGIVVDGRSLHELEEEAGQ